MNKNKIAVLVYYALLLISMALLFNVCLSLSELLQTSPLPDNLQTTYNALQKKAALMGIIAFVIMLIISLVLYYINSKPTYIVLTNLAYVALVLFVFVTINQNFFQVQNLTYNEKSEYWITVFMGIFYIIGAVLVSAIGFITVRNYSKRTNHTLNKINR